MIHYEILAFSHLEGVSALERECFSIREQWADEFLRPYCADHSGFVALDNDNRVVGVVIIKPENRQYHVVSLAVTLSHRRLGIASTLLNTSLAKYPTEWHLYVRASNAPAQECYLRLGFESIEVIPNYYPDPIEDAFHMRRSAPAPEGAISCLSNFISWVRN